MKIQMMICKKQGNLFELECSHSLTERRPALTAFRPILQNLEELQSALEPLLIKPSIHPKSQASQRPASILCRSFKQSKGA